MSVFQRAAMGVCAVAVTATLGACAHGEPENRISENRTYSQQKQYSDCFQGLATLVPERPAVVRDDFMIQGAYKCYQTAYGAP